jgi:gas vesicle protein
VGVLFWEIDLSVYLFGMPDIVATSDSWFNNTPLLVGLVALIGTLLGAIIGAVTQYLIATQKQKDAAKAEEGRNRIEIKRAARLIQMELLAGYAALKSIVKFRAWTLAKTGTDDWKKYSHVLAPVMSDKDWLDLCVAEMSLDYIESSRDKAVGATPPMYELSEQLSVALNVDLERIDRGLTVLQPWHLDPQPLKKK